MLRLLCSLITSLNTTNPKLTWVLFLFNSDLTAELQQKLRSVTSFTQSETPWLCLLNSGYIHMYRGIYEKKNPIHMCKDVSVHM